MKSDHYRKVAVIAVVGAGILIGLKNLSSTLPKKFPHLDQESTPVVEVPMMPWEAGLEPVEKVVVTEPPPPLIAEEPKVAEAPSKPQSAKRSVRKLVTSTALPDLPVNVAATVDQYRTHSPFIITPSLAAPVEFWARIYGVYTSDNVIIHDTEDLSIVYNVLDFSSLNKRDISDAEKKNIREFEVNKAMSDIKATLDPALANRLRSQTGMKNRFGEGLKRSGRYIVWFEKILAAQGMPTEISRLPFVESLFNEKAFSKVQAAGLWQFMAESARKYMTVNSLVDERYDPLIACHGAAKLLKHNYELLGTWPLAINAYNSGPGNLMKAMNALGTKDIAKIINGYRGGSYAFASRNFYPSFLAALHVYENRKKFFGDMPIESPMEFDSLELPTTMSFPEIAYLSQTTLTQLKSLNPAFESNVIRGAYSLPPGSQVRIPHGTQNIFAARFLDFKASAESADLYIVESGDTYDSIAIEHQLNRETLKNLNALLDTLQDGNVLRLPQESALATTENNQ